jgi:trans-aconitate methyltransferase
MKIYQLKARVDPYETITIGTYLHQSDCFDALADWSENERAIKKHWDSLTDEQQDKFHDKIQAKIPMIYDTYEGFAWVEECEVIQNYDPKSLDFDFDLLKM